jgi:DnaJ-class molecular chaperone
MGVQIICGDCAGDGLSPYKTYLDHKGNCQQCGGHSYELASVLAVHALQMRAARMAESHAAFGNGRVIPFEVPARTTRSEKIAV